jgi:hypothetical protein
MSDIKSESSKPSHNLGIILLGGFFAAYGLFELCKVSYDIVFDIVSRVSLSESKSVAGPLNFQNIFNLCYLLGFVITGYGLIRHKLWSRFSAIALSALYVFLLMSNIAKHWGVVGLPELLPYGVIIFIPIGVIIYLNQPHISDCLTE